MMAPTYTFVDSIYPLWGLDIRPRPTNHLIARLLSSIVQRANQLMAAWQIRLIDSSQLTDSLALASLGINWSRGR